MYWEDCKVCCGVKWLILLQLLKLNMKSCLEGPVTRLAVSQVVDFEHG